jgi:hypothetical protein
MYFQSTGLLHTGAFPAKTNRFFKLTANYISISSAPICINLSFLEPILHLTIEIRMLTRIMQNLADHTLISAYSTNILTAEYIVIVEMTWE